MQQKTINMIRMQVLERAGKRLRNLLRGTRSRIVGKSMILPVAVGELGLQKKFVADESTAHDGVGERFAYGSLEVVLPLIRGVKRAEAGAQRERDQLRSAVFFPRSAVDEGGCFRGPGHSEWVAFRLRSDLRSTSASLRRARRI